MVLHIIQVINIIYLNDQIIQNHEILIINLSIKMLLKVIKILHL